MYQFTRICLRRSLRDVFHEEKRFAGHSKWANIKHTKAAKDAEKSAMIQNFVRKMKVAIAEGKSSKPGDNIKLATIMDEAKKKCVPQATIAATLEKAQNSKIKSQTEILDFRGPGNSIFIIKLFSSNMVGLKFSLNTIFKKTHCQLGEGKLKSMFDHQGYIITNIKGDLNSATEDAISIGAEDVQEFDDNGKFYKFICDPAHVGKVAGQLKKLDYDVLTSDEEFLPNVTCEPNEEAVIMIEKLLKRLDAVDEVIAIYNNIDIPDEEQNK